MPCMKCSLSTSISNDIALGSVPSQGVFVGSCPHLLHPDPCEQHHEFFRWLAGLGRAVQSYRTDLPVRVANWSGEEPMTLASLPWKILPWPWISADPLTFPISVWLHPKWLSLVKAGLAKKQASQEVRMSLAFCCPHELWPMLKDWVSSLYRERFVSGLFMTSASFLLINPRPKCVSWVSLLLSPSSNLLALVESEFLLRN